MKLNHLNLTVTDVAEAREFLTTYFGLKPIGGNDNLTVLSDDGGMVLTLTHMKVGRETEVKYPVTFHIGFIQESMARVNEINEQLKQAGFEVAAPSRQHGSWTFYFQAPGGFMVEVLS